MRTRPDLAQRNRDNAKHGMSYSPVYFCYNEMKYRCNRKSHHAYKDYGGRGIKVCNRWLGEDGFDKFMNDMGMPPEGHEIDRKDNNLGYSPDNCRWVLHKANTRNRRSNKMITYKGITKCLAQWAEDLDIDRKALAMRLKVRSVEESFETPYIRRNKK